jgi:hypothetical protein
MFIRLMILTLLSANIAYGDGFIGMQPSQGFGFGGPGTGVGMGGMAHAEGFMYTGKISDLDKIKDPYSRHFLVADVLVGVVHSGDRQAIIDKYVIHAPPEEQDFIYSVAFHRAVYEKRFEAADEVLKLASREDSGKVATLYCNYIEFNLIPMGMNTDDSRKVMKDALSSIEVVSEKYKLMNQPCGTRGTLKDIIRDNFPEMEAKPAPQKAVVAVVSDKQRYARWKCTEKDLKGLLQTSFNTVNSFKGRNSALVMTDVPCSLYGKISRGKDGNISFKLDESQMGIKFEVPNVKSVKDILASMKKAKLLSEEGAPIVDEKKVEGARKALEAEAGVAKDDKGDKGHAVMFPFVERKFENQKSTGQR